MFDPTDNEMVMDHTSNFTTHNYFKSRDELISWVRNTGKELGMVIIIRRSDNSKRQRPRVTLGCELMRRCQAKKSSPGKHQNVVQREGEMSMSAKKLTRTRNKCGCPFQLYGRETSIDGQWVLKVVCGMHNHPPYLDGHIFSGQSTPNKKKLVVDIPIADVNDVFSVANESEESSVEIVNLTPTSLLAPDVTQPRLEEAESKQRSFDIEYVDQLPSHLQPYITGTKDVESDGHCGFRAIAGLLGYGENECGRVRRELLEELTKFEDLYTCAFIQRGSVQKQRERLNCFEEIATESHWMSLPDAGYLIASRYNVALVTLCPGICVTYLPLRTSIVDPPKCICIALVNKNHFIQVFMCEGHPLPPVTYKWYECRYHRAAGWRNVYTRQLEMYNNLER